MLDKANIKTVFVGLSGGVDSSVAALRLKQRGFHVVGVFIKVWQPDFLKCDWEQERLDAMRVAAHLEIPFLTCDAEADYKKGVGDYFVREYLAGRTPNPDVMCNRYVKFGAFLKFAKERGADYIATGHYAEVREEDGTYRLYRGKDQSKDQSYFLWTLTQEELKNVLLPVGDTLKEDIRKEAAAAGLPTAVKKDSQGICFLGHVDIPEFLSHYVKLVPGVVINTSGEQIGTHKGALVYTLGQRQGFIINNSGQDSRPHFVVDKDMENNTITVDIKPPLITSDSHFTLTDVSWTADEPVSDTLVEAATRYRQTPFVAKIQKQGDIWSVYPEISIDKPSSGQSCVIYKGDECLGGGIIA